VAIPQKFKSAPENLPEIAKQFGVNAYFTEGVQADSYLLLPNYARRHRNRSLQRELR
jgi:hypothetical protein